MARDRAPGHEAGIGPERGRAHQCRCIAEPGFRRRDKLGRRLRRIADRYQHIAHETLAADPLDGGTGEQRPEPGIVEPGKLGETRRGQCGAGQEFGFFRRTREFVPGADRETVVAAIDAVADQRPQCGRDRPLVLDRQIRDAAPCIEPIRGRERGGRAGVETAPAGAAMIALGRVGRQRHAEKNLPEKHPGAETAGHEIGMLALPADSGLLRQRLFHDRRGIDKHL